ncbi:TPA: glutamate--tRNA ligase [Candidatus Saccharibacteria bacterium]|nr:glutamate--tRNA ligase [Candidatus Saccharibacteria bacterium]HIO87613.1 glutamate--tRNA ligase [Candidatus Saccharibacteria bacterium]
MEQKIVTRFAPSPTGYMHIGAARTAIFAWLLAQQSNGEFILRIEDTDKNREVQGSEAHLIESLKWLGLNWTQGPDIGGEAGPYRQSERLEIYARYAQKLVDEGKAYADTTTPEQLTKWREKAKAEKRPFHFNDHRPANPPEWQIGLPLRLKIDEPQSPAWNDEVRGPQKESKENIDDFILMKADGYPTYNFAHIVDDFEMGVTHVIRGEEFVSSVPKYLMLYKALGITPPVFAHLPSILAPTGNKKLSKRDGAPDLLQYRDQGYLPDAILNFLVKLGWNDGTEQEVYSRADLIDSFSLDRVQKSGARYDEKQLNWISGHHIRTLELDDIYELSKQWWPEEAASADDDLKKKILSLIQEKLKKFSEIPDATRFFFTRPDFNPRDFIANDKQLKKLTDTELTDFLEAAIEKLQQSDFSEQDLETALRNLVDELETKVGVLFKLIRISVTGSTVAPGLFETLAVLGKDESLERIRIAQSKL